VISNQNHQLNDLKSLKSIESMTLVSCINYIHHFMGCLTLASEIDAHRVGFLHSTHVHRIRVTI